MVVRRLAAFFTLIAFVCFAGTWMFRTLMGYATPDVTSMLNHGLVIILAYFLIGIFLARLGVSLVKEALEDKRQVEEEKRERARNLYLTAISGGKGMFGGGGGSVEGNISSEE